MSTPQPCARILARIAEIRACGNIDDVRIEWVSPHGDQAEVLIVPVPSDVAAIATDWTQPIEPVRMMIDGARSGGSPH